MNSINSILFMKHPNENKWTLVVLVCFFALILYSCEERKEQSPPYDPNIPIQGVSFAPLEGGLATKVILTGSNFGNDPKKVKVYFNEKRAAVVNTNGEKIYVITPRQPGDTCLISVVVGSDSIVYKDKFIYHIRTTVTTVAGKPGTTKFVGGSLAETEFPTVTYLAVDAENNLFVGCRGDGGDYNKNKYVMLNEMTGISTVLIDETGSPPNQPCMLDDGKTVYIPLDNGTGYWTLTSENMWKPRKRDMYAAPGHNLNISFKHAFAFCEIDGYMYIREKGGNLMRMNPETSETEVVANALMAESDSYLQFSLDEPHILYLAYTNKNCIYTYNIQTKEHKLYAGTVGKAGAIDGDRLDAEFNEPRQMLFDSDGTMYLADTKNHTIRKITPDGMVSTVIGQPGVKGYVDGNPDDALFNEPVGVTITKSGIIYVGDSQNKCVRKLAIE